MSSLSARFWELTVVRYIVSKFGLIRFDSQKNILRLSALFYCLYFDYFYRFIIVSIIVYVDYTEEEIITFIFMEESIIFNYVVAVTARFVSGCKEKNSLSFRQ
jgi:hypothetical protein